MSAMFKLRINCFLILHMVAICICNKQTNGKREGFKSQYQEVIIVSPESVSVTGNATYGPVDKTNMASGKSKYIARKKKSKKRVSSSVMMDSLQQACSNLRKYAANSKYAKDVIQGNVSAEMLSRLPKQLENGEPCSPKPYAAALKIFIQTCTVIESCPLPSNKPSYNFKLPKGAKSKNGDFTPSRITQLYVVVPAVFSPDMVDLNSRSRNEGPAYSRSRSGGSANSRSRNGGSANRNGGSANSRSRNGGSSRRTVVNYANLPASLPSWFPDSSMTQMQQMHQMQRATYRAIANKKQQRMITPPPVPGTTTESDSVD